MAVSGSILSVRNLTVFAILDGQTVRIVDDVSFDIERGVVFGLIGESGSGKSVTSSAIAGLQPASLAGRTQGEIFLDGQDLSLLSPTARRDVLGLEIGVVFQDPLSALNPSLRVGWQIGETLRVRRGLSRADADSRAVALLNEVGIRNPTEVAQMYPHQLSGGMRQRVMIAIAISCEPKLLIADEPTTALDPTVQRQVLDLMTALARKRDLAVLLITHNIGVVAQYADKVGVMYQGSLVERGSAAQIIANPQHDYSRRLIEAAVTLDNYADRRRRLLTESAAS